MQSIAKTTEFRPSIPDENGALRRAFKAGLKKSGLTRSGFAHKVMTEGLRVMADRRAK